jgi:hypothetical protein
VIGSGLTGLGVALGLPARRRVLVFTGPAQGRDQFYDATRTVPCAHLGFGGLGNFWHGVIPTGGRFPLAGCDPAVFEQLFRRFYPRTDVVSRLGSPWLFVPWRPIRPKFEWRRLASERNGRLTLIHEMVTRFARAGREINVHASGGIFRAGRIWVCAGALHTPFLLDRSLGARVSRTTVSDHVICYLGLIDRAMRPDVAPPRVERTTEGIWFEARPDESGAALCTLRPARFAFKRLDYGIEQRAVFGLPTGSVVSKILRRASPGLLAEALYNRTGFFPGARVQSVYAQIAVPDAHWLREGSTPLEMRTEIIRAAADRIRANPPWRGLIASRRPDVFIPGIHLHHSVDLRALQAADVNSQTASVQVVDASVREQIGPEHHSLKLMFAAAHQARTLSEAS